MSNDDRDPEQLFDERMNNTRIDAEAPDDKTESSTDRVDAIADELAAIEAGDAPPNLTIRDNRLAALLRGLPDDDLTALSTAAQEGLDRDPDSSEDSVSATLRYLVRLGIAEADPDLLDDGRDAYEQWLQSQADEF